MGIFFGKNGGQAAGSKGWQSSRQAAKRAGTTDFKIAQEKHARAVAAKKRADAKAAKLARQQAENVKAARASAAAGRARGARGR